MSAKPRVVLIDLSGIFWACWHSSAAEVISQAYARALEMVKRCCLGDGTDLIAICCDAGRSFRKDIMPTYKATRPETSHNALGELDRLKRKLEQEGFLLWSADGFEADDVIATATDKACGLGHTVRICSADKDLLQLVGTGRDVMRIHNWETWTAETVFERLKVIPAQIVDLLALTGDKTDNIPGCPGVGAVRAAELLGKYSTVAGLYAAMEEGKQVATPALYKALKENRAAVELSRRLVELRYDAPIDFETIYAERKPARLTEEDPDMDEPAKEYDDPKAEPAPPAGASASASPTSVSTDGPDSSPRTGESVALVPVPVEYTKALEPTSIGTAFKLAKGLFESRLYTRFQNPEAIMAVIIRGREMGYGALTALDCFHVIEGKPSPIAHLLIARAKADPDCAYFTCIETTKERATWETVNKRNPSRVLTHSYTIEEAKEAGLVKPGRSGEPNQWMKRPADMLRKTAGVQLARMEYPEAALGLYAAEELSSD